MSMLERLPFVYHCVDCGRWLKCKEPCPSLSWRKKGRRFNPASLSCPGTGCTQRGTKEWLSGEHCPRVHGTSYEKLVRLRRKMDE